MVHAPAAALLDRAMTSSPVAHTLTAEQEARVIAVILSPLEEGERAFDAFARKERELLELFWGLTPAASRVLEKRLRRTPSAADPVAAAFWRLVGERRERLLAHLADAHRRHVLGLRNS